MRSEEMEAGDLAPKCRGYERFPRKAPGSISIVEFDYPEPTAKIDGFAGMTVQRNLSRVPIR